MTTTNAAVLSDSQDRQTESNREIAIDFLTRAARGEARDAMQRYAAPDFVHHNPWFAPDAPSLADAMDANARENPQKELHVQRTIAEGPLVAVHASVRHKPDERPAADHTNNAQVSFVTSKFGVRGITNALREHLRKDKISVTCINPGELAAEVPYEEGAEKAIHLYEGTRIPVQDIVSLVQCVINLSAVSCVKEINVPAITDLNA